MENKDVKISRSGADGRQQFAKIFPFRGDLCLTYLRCCAPSGRRTLRPNFSPRTGLILSNQPTVGLVRCSGRPLLPLGRVAHGLLPAKAAFTLLEMLLVVLIVGILTAVALPMYQRAVYKSRFSKLMLPAKSLASANEAFFLANGEYSELPAQLDVGSDTAVLPDGSSILLSTDDTVSFVRLSNAEVPNARYVVYQQRSANFAGTTMCESLDSDDRATWLCAKGLNGTKVDGGNSGAEAGWSAYILTGTAGANDQFPIPCPDNSVCDAQGNVTGCASGYHSNGNECVETPPCPENSVCNEQGQVTSCSTGYVLNINTCVSLEEQLQSLAASLCPSNQTMYVCTIKNDVVSWCDKNRATITGGECVSNGTSTGNYEIVYNPDGTEKQKYHCDSVKSGHCYSGSFYDYAAGTGKQRTCADKAAINKNLTCSNGYIAGTDYIIDSDKHITDANVCSVVNTQGVCTTYSDMIHHDNTYDGATRTHYVDGLCASISGTTCVDNNYKNVLAYKDNGISRTYVQCYGSYGGTSISVNGTCPSGFSIQQQTTDTTTGQTTYKNCTSYNTIDWVNATCS